MEKQKDYVEIDILHILQILLQRIWILIITGIVGAVVAFLFAAILITPKYESKVMLYVNNSSFSVGSSSFSISSSDLTAAQSLVDTYIVILNTRTTLNEVIEVSGVDYSYAELKSMISASAENGTEIFSVTVTSADPAEAKTIANTIAKVLPDKVESIVDGASMRVVDYAVTPTTKSSPNIMKYTLIGMLLGIVLSAAALIIQDLLDDTIHDPEYLRTTYPDIPLLSSIPDLFEDENEVLGVDQKGGKK